MDSLHVTSTPSASAVVGSHVIGMAGNSKTSSRSASPCRPRLAEAQQQVSPAPAATTYHGPHHVKTLSHGSVDSAKSQDAGQRQAKHRSPTTSLNRTTDLDDSNQIVYMDESGNLTELDVSDVYCPGSFISNGSSDARQDDETDCTDPKTNAILEHLGNKIVRVRDLIRTEQKLRDDNVNEYLKLAANADKQQVQRIKAVFEKKNQKSAQVIAQLQKKLDAYQKKVHELEKHGAIQSHRPPREVLRDMGQGLKNVGGNIRDGISYVGGSVMSKPREFAHLIKNKFGSADNISQLSSGGFVSFQIPIIRNYISSTWYVGPTGPGGTPGGAPGGGASGTAAGSGSAGGSDQGDKHQTSSAGHREGRPHRRHHGGSATLPAAASQASMMAAAAVAAAAGGGPQGPGAVQQKFSDDGSECSSVTSDSIGRYGRSHESHQDAYLDLHKKTRIIQDQVDGLRENFDIVKTLQTEIHDLNVALQEERFRSERLEEQINDLTELHQNEVENLKQAMADMEEKVQYQSEERLRDIHEMLEHCQTKIQKMEHQALQQQQYVTLEGLDNSNARALVVKLINVLLTVLQVVLLLVATGAGIIMPFLRTRLRILSTVIIVIGVAFVLRQWPEVQDIGSHMMRRLKDTLDPVQ
ncbi:unnamed protein product [Acanthoscelides obtectus]|uniref:Transmembrane and coiled-coil domains protein 2 n=1 Tax=Acanthoscelides obtectus TaxID=200917 RepID=A0A9P0Q070_ACAOB|nr:unnamed protein product [Acanthoscelides obtectus]CAK1670342.1 Transmembrane and coiled-coil domains protein 1 [Acanthoscelides obtectus]